MGVLIGWFANRVRSLPTGILFGLLVGAFFAFLVALMPGEGGEHYYWEIMLPRDRAGTHRRVRHAALRESATTATGMSRDQPARMSR